MIKVFYSYKFWISVCLLLYISLFFFEKTNLAASDLGRHIKNGEIIWQSGNVFHTNLYSYTHPDFAAPNHHWLFGLISYFTHQIGGFNALTLLGALLYTLSVASIFYFSYKETSFYPALTATVLSLPLLTDRAETRPEAFSLFFFTLIYIVLARVLKQKNLKQLWKVLLGCGITLAFWINIHIFFVLSGIVGIAAAIHGLINKQKNVVLWMSSIALAFIIGSFINPLGIKLILYPLEIFNNYGYRVSENQPLWFFLQHFTRPIHWYIVFVTLLYLAALFILRKKLRKYFYYIFLSTFFLVFTFKLIRMENILGITIIPVFSLAIHTYEDRINSIFSSIKKSTTATMGVSIATFIAASAIIGSGLFFPLKYTFGIGLLPNYDQSIAFIQNLHLQGTIFNNFDSGSFLIYALYPEQNVFIDNRAEAYPADFIQKSYLQAQENETKWHQLEQKYFFSAIIFYRHEQTNWGQEFLVKRIQDQTWVPVYVDDYIIIFLKDSETNKELIDKYRLPSEMFSISTD